jgi:hypothetical protein
MLRFQHYRGLVRDVHAIARPQTPVTIEIDNRHKDLDGNWPVVDGDLTRESRQSERSRGRL